MSRRLPALAVGIAVASLAPSAARADTVGIVDVSAVGVPDAAIERFETSVEDGMRGAGFTVEPRSAVRDALKRSPDYVEGCGFGPCMRAVFDVTGLEHALTVRVQAVGSTFTFIASLVDTKSGALKAQVSETCAACSIDDAAHTASMLGSELLLASSAASHASGGALATGAPVPAAVESRRSNLRTAAWVSLGAAVVAGAAGGYLLAEDDDQTGAALVSGGGVALLGSVTMFVFSRRF